MTPYYADDSVTIYHGDALDVLPTVEADVAITDPPYNVGVRYGAGTDDRREDYAAWCRDWFEQLRRMTSAVALSPGFPNVGLWCGIEPPAWIIAGLKPAAMGRSPFGFCNWEPVFFWGKAHQKAATDVFTAPIVLDRDVEGHPCPKQLRWGTALVALLTQPGHTVLDPFLGSGTTAVAAKRLGRKAVGIEIEERYCEIAATRCSQEVLGLVG